MPFFLIPATLGVCFCLIWLFIGGMIFRDGQLAAQQEQEYDGLILPLPPQRVRRPLSGRRNRPKRFPGKPARAAS